MDPSQALPETHVTCPGCQTVYSSVDSTPEHVRVRAFLLQVECMCDKLREVKEWLRAGAPGRALEKVETIETIPVRIAELTIRDALNHPEFAHPTIDALCLVIADFDKERCADPGCDFSPISASERELLACKILNSLFGTNL